MVKGNNKVDKKTVYFVSIVVLVVILVVILFVTLNRDSPVKLETNDQAAIEEIPTTTGIVLDLGYEVDFLTKCLSVNGQLVSERPEELKKCPSIKGDDLKRLKYLNSNVSGEVVCNSFGVNDDGTKYWRCSDYVTGCDHVFTYDWITPGQSDQKTYALYNCRGTYYYSYSHTLPKENLFIRINFDSKLYNKMVYGL